MVDVNMISRSNLLVVAFIAFLFGGCFDDVTEPPFITDAQWELIKTVVRENNFPESTPLYSFVVYIYDEWPNEYRIKDFFLTFPIQDENKPRKLVLSDVLTKIGKPLRIRYDDPRTGSVYPANIDSIEIRTDSVIIIPGLSLSFCKLTHLPPQIGKIRTKTLGIEWNYQTLRSLPNELMQMTDPPKYWDSLKVTYEIRIINAMNSDSVSDTLKSWLKSHYAGK
jgi:hypothetical protein